MGLYKLDKCIFTGFQVQNIPSDMDGFEYSIQIEQKKYLIRLPFYATEWAVSKSFFTANKYLFHGLLLNNKWFEDEEKIIDIDRLQTLITISDYPKTHKQKLENLFLFLIKLQKEDGEKVIINDILWSEQGWRKLYFKTSEECVFYLNHLESEGFINLQKGFLQGVSVLAPYTFTILYKGLGYSIKLQEDGENSRKCFVAMSFDPSVSEIRQAIKKALTYTNYEFILIDEQNIESDKTINDEIIANLKSCKFCIADFTLHSNGVYFESGFALGQGKKVIYTCSESQFGKSHFDIKPLQHIIYSSTDELTRKLVNKIKAFID